MTKVFDKLGVQFAYPDNWELDAEELQESNHSVSVYGPNDSFWSLQINPAEVEPQIMTEEALQVMREEYPDLESHPKHDIVAGHELVGFDMNFFCLDLTNTAQVRAFRDGAASYLIFCQAEDHDYETAQAVFAAITQSLLDETPRPV